MPTTNLPAWNAVAGFPSWRRKATFAATSEATGYPAAALSDTDMDWPWRSTDAQEANTVITWTMDTDRRHDLLVVCRHNLSIDATFNVTLYADTGMTTVLTSVSGVEAWPAVFSEDEVDWEGDRWWDRTYTQEEIEGYPWDFPIQIPGSYYAKAGKLEIVDPLNPAGYVEVGMLEPTEEFRFPVNFDIGADHGYRGRSISIEADDGAKIVRRRRKPRVFNGSVSFLDQQTGMARFLEMRRQLDQDEPFFWWPDPSDEANRVRTAYMARWAELSLHRYADALDTEDIPIRIEEWL